MKVVILCVYGCCVFFKQKTAYEMRISDWSSDVCSSDLQLGWIRHLVRRNHPRPAGPGCVEILAGDHAVLLPVAHRAVVEAGITRDMRQCVFLLRSEERRVGKECVSTCRSRWSPYH